MTDRFGQTNRAGGRLALVMLVSVTLVGVLAIPTANASTHARAATHRTTNPICKRLGHLGLSAGAYMYCRRPVKPATKLRSAARFSRAAGAPANVNAASLAEDVTPAGVRAYGQSEESVAALGGFVVEAWNDSTGFFANCGAPNSKEELTGYGFSNNGGKSFRDEGGLPNSGCASGWRFEGDPSVEAVRSGGKTYFYIQSLYLNSNTGQSDIALDACQVSGSGSTAKLLCNSTVTVVAAGCSTGCDFLDKDYLALDAKRGRLYSTYTRFGTSGAGQIELAVCNISGASAAHPACSPGASSTPYLVVQPANLNCENEGAYPAVDAATGNVYVAWEFNWATNYEVSACYGSPTQNKLALIPASCLTLPTTTCTGPAKTTAVKIGSLDAAAIPGYNRSPMNDFPRIAVSDKFGTATLVWNDARKHATGDILMQSYKLGSSLKPVQKTPLRLNDNKGPTWAFMPALRNADKSGLLDVIWFDRRNSTPSCEACTDVYAALRVSPDATKTPTTNARVTNVSSNWNAQSSDIVPNFGDYTDDFVAGTLVYMAWADGRLSDPQPFSAHTGG